MSQINVRNLSNENGDGAPDIVGVSTFSATSYFVPPVGNTQQRPTNPQGGDLRVNTDTASLEYYRGDTIGWSQIELIDPELGGGTGSNTGLGTRGLFAGGLAPDIKSDIDYITISTLGNTQDFGDISAGKQAMSALGSRTRALNIGGYTTSFENEIEFVTFASLGNITDFGNLLSSKNRTASCSDQVRGITGGGNPNTNVIEYLTIAQTGNGVDFGDQTVKRDRVSGCSNGHGGL